MPNDNADILLIKTESITNLLALLEDIFSMKHNTEAELAMAVLKILISDLKKEICKCTEINCTKKIQFNFSLLYTAKILLL